MDDVTRALEKAAEIIGYANVDDWDAIARAAVLAFLKEMPVFVGNDANRGAFWNPATMAEAIAALRARGEG